jgi:hypothetical protein
MAYTHALVTSVLKTQGAVTIYHSAVKKTVCLYQAKQAASSARASVQQQQHSGKRKLTNEHILYQGCSLSVIRSDS